MPTVAHREEYQLRMKALESQGLSAQLDLLWEEELCEKAAQGHRGFPEKRPWLESMLREWSAALGMTPEALFTSMERARRYWSASYYQPANQPPLSRVRVFETQADVERAIPKGTLFKCPMCDGLSKHPTQCDTGLRMGNADKVCDWKACGLFRTMGKGFRCVVKERVLAGDFQVFEIFWPMSIETKGAS